MRLRLSFGAVFLVLVLVSAYLGFSDTTMPVNDKAMHFTAFFALTTAFYWIVETTRRRAINTSLLVCTVLGGIGSEFLQAFLPYRAFDAFDIVANLIGSGLAVLLNTLYHRRMLERKRSARSQYQNIPENEIEFVGHEAGTNDEDVNEAVPSSFAEDEASASK